MLDKREQFGRVLIAAAISGMPVLFVKALYPKARLIAIEPEPITFQKLNANIEQNSLENVIPNQCALSDTDGTIDLYRGDEGIGSLNMSLYRERMPGTSTTVPARRLSSFTFEPVDLLKQANAARAAASHRSEL
jgi:FkbM family methyltransferase